MDPIGTVRREDHREGEGHSIWVRQDPGYPDSEMTDTEWTCIWSTAPGNIGYRLGDRITEHSRITGYVPGTPAQTATDIQLNDRVETLPGALYWTDEPAQGVVLEIVGHPNAYCAILFDEPQVVVDPLKGQMTFAHWGVPRLGFRLLEEDFS